jgi:hypothetical protein
VNDNEGCVWFVLCLLFFVGYYAWYSKWGYALYYEVSPARVWIDDKPHDCDFLRAPMGEKECRYKRVVSTVEWAKSQADTPIASYDGGKSWSDFTADAGTSVPQFATVVSVNVSWQKVEE